MIQTCAMSGLKNGVACLSRLRGNDRTPKSRVGDSVSFNEPRTYDLLVCLHFACHTLREFPAAAGLFSLDFCWKTAFYR
jgi:hypothetical protein